MHQLGCNPDWICTEGSSKCISETRSTHQFAEISGQLWQGSFIRTVQREGGLLLWLIAEGIIPENMCA